MESNPAYYQDPEDVRVEVGQVGSGPNQEHLTDQVIKLLLIRISRQIFGFEFFRVFLDFILFLNFPALFRFRNCKQTLATLPKIPKLKIKTFVIVPDFPSNFCFLDF